MVLPITAEEVFRDNVTLGDPSSGVYPIEKFYERLWGTGIETELAATAAIATSAAAGELIPVRLLTTVDVPTATGMENGDTFDGVVLVTGDRICKAVVGGSASNGIWIVPASGAATRSTDADTGLELAYKRFTVSAGTYAGQTWFVKTNPIATLNTTPVEIQLSKAADAYAGEIVSGRGGKASLTARADLVDRQGADIPSAATTSIGAATGGYVNVTGTVTITSLGAGTAGELREVCFTGILTLTHNASSLILPGGVSIVTAAGDVGTFRSLGGSNWRCVGFSFAAGAASASEVTTARGGKASLSIRHDLVDRKGADLASAATASIGAATGGFVDITGTVTITSFGAGTAGELRTVRFTGILTLTHNGTSLILPKATNIVTAAGDVGTFRSLGGSNWVCENFEFAVASPIEAEVAASRGGKTTLPLLVSTVVTPLETDGYQDLWLTYRPVTSTATPSTRTYLFRATATRDSTVDEIKFFCMATGTIKIKVFATLASGSAYANVSHAIGSTGLVTLTSADFGTINVPAGYMVAITVPTGVGAITNNNPLEGAYSDIAGDVTALASPVASVSNRPQIAIKLKGKAQTVTGTAFNTGTVDLSEVKTRMTDSYATYTIGRSAIAVGTTEISSGSFVFAVAATRTGRMKNVRYAAGASSGDLVVRTFTKSGNDFTATGRQAVIATTGGAGLVNTNAVDFIVNKGEYVGFYTRGGLVKFTNVADDDTGFYNGTVDTSPWTDASISTSSVRLEIGFDIQYFDLSAGLETRIANLETGLRSIGGETTPYLLVADGDSLTQGSGGAVSYATQLATFLGCPFNNQGISGQTILDMQTDAAATIDPLLSTSGVRPILIVWEYINYYRDAGGRTAVTAVNELETYCLARRTAGWTRIIVINAIAHSGLVGSWNPAANASMIAYNAELASRYSTFADKLVDVSVLNDPTSVTYYQGDGIHLTTAGQYVVLQKVRGQLSLLREF